MPKYVVRVTGMVESNDWYEVNAEDEDEAAEKACYLAENDGLEDPQISSRPKMRKEL